MHDGRPVPVVDALHPELVVEQLVLQFEIAAPEHSPQARFVHHRERWQRDGEGQRDQVDRVRLRGLAVAGDVRVVEYTQAATLVHAGVRLTRLALPEQVCRDLRQPRARRHRVPPDRRHLRGALPQPRLPPAHAPDDQPRHRTHENHLETAG